MEQDTSQNIPKYLTDIINSPELFAALDRIEKNLDLHIDQTGELYVIVSNIILRKTKSSDFSKDVMEKLEVNADMANKIMLQTNKEIFDVMKSKLQSEPSIQVGSTISNIEHAGNFSVEKEEPVETNGNGVTYADRDKILDGLENPQPSQGHRENRGQVDPPANLPTVSDAPENYTEPLVDYLLSSPIAQGEKKVVLETKDTVAQVKKPPMAPQKQGPDPYREATK